MSFLSNTYKRYQFDFLRIITEEDLFWLKNRISNQNLDYKLCEKDNDFQIINQYDKIKNEKFILRSFGNTMVCVTFQIYFYVIEA